MGEVAVSNEEVVNLEAEEAEAENTVKKEDGSPSVVRWERFLPRRVLRVLLVEADDSTRQLITALLRKCSYRVAAVSDGLKAWEVLKGKPHHIDLILTEVDLPSISGFALLTLIMEHEICKNIPIIMMSSQDSVSLVYKCMMRGAADFLVKPVRINELKNLWQHVWRRQTSRRGGNGSQDEGAAQQKVEATAENNAASNHSSGYIACLQTNRECIEKGSDAQSSCANPDLEAEKAYPENMQYRSQPKWSKSSESDIKTQRQEECGISSRKRMRHDCEDNGFEVASCKDANAMTHGEDVAPEGQEEQNNITSEACDNSHVLLNSSRAAIDLIGAFDDYTKCSYRSLSSDDGTNKVDSSPPLDLSLRRSPPCGSVNQVSNERRMLNHSDASAFSRYVNRAVQFLHSSASTGNQQKDYGINSDRQLSSRTLHYNSDTRGLAPSCPQNMLSLGTGQCGQAEVSFPCPQKKVFPVAVPVRSVMFDNLCPPYGCAVPPIFSMLSGLSTGQSHQEPLNAFHPSNLETRNSPPLDNANNHTANNCTLQTEHKQRQNLDSLEDRRRFSSATDQSASSSFCNGTASHPNSIGFVSNANVDQVQAARTAIESRNEGLPIHDRNCNRSFQREAALTKFRLKRKERCFEKKVRYESRKKLAEERPRVKGQFVRHLPAEPAVALVETDSPCGNS